MATERTITNLRGPAARIIAVDATTVPAGSPAQVAMTGPDQGRQFEFFIPEAMPHPVAVGNDEAFAAALATQSSETHTSARKVITDEIGGLAFTPAVDVRNITLAAATPFPVGVAYGVLYGARGATLSSAPGPAGPWTAVRTLPAGDAITAVKETGDGEILVSRNTAGLWRSSGWAANPTTATFTNVLPLADGSHQFTYDIDLPSGWCVATNYISGRDMTPSRYVWLSKDRGVTWTIIFDKMAAHPTLAPSTSHMHAVGFDAYVNPSNPRIFASYHKTDEDPTNIADPLKRVIYSDDSGVTWAVLSTNDQPVTLTSVSTGLVFGSDTPPNAVYGVVRKPNPADMTVQTLHIIRQPDNTGMFGWDKATVKDDTGALHMVYRSSVANTPGVIVSTDGVRVTEIARFNPTVGGTVDFLTVMIHNGLLIGAYNTGDGIHTVSMPVPKRGITPSGFGALTGGFAGPISAAAGTGSYARLYGVAIGEGAAAGVATGSHLDSHYSVAVGYKASGRAEAVAIGASSVAASQGSAVGFQAKAASGVAVGRNSESLLTATALGVTSKATGIEATALGAFTTVAGEQGVGVGHGATAAGQYSVAVGRGASASAASSVAIGRGASATHASSFAMGVGTATNATNQVAIGGRALNMTPSGVPANVAGAASLFVRTVAGKQVLSIVFATGTPINIATEA